MYCQATALETMVAAFLQCFKSLELPVKKRKKTIPGALPLFDVKIHLTSAPARFKMTAKDSLGGD
jgi:hypothetical protein